jgi:ABC-type multidrug transport system fused ATPase/permease subunit
MRNKTDKDTSSLRAISDIGIVAWFLRPYLKQALFIFAMLFLYSVLETVSIGALYPFTTNILGASGGSYGGRMLAALERIASMLPVSDPLVATSMFLLALIIASNLVGFASDSFALRYQLRLYADLQNDIYHKILNNQYRYFHDKKQGELVYIAREASTAVGEMFFYFPKAGVECFRIIAITVLLLTISFSFTLATYGLISFFAVLVYILSIRIVHPAATKALNARTALTDTLAESVAGIRQVKLFGSANYWLTKFRKLTAVDRKFQFWSVAPSYLPTYLILSVTALCTIGSVIYVRLYRAGDFAVILPVVIVYIGALMRMMPSIAKVGHYWMGLKGLVPRMRVTYETLHDDAYLVQDGSMDFKRLQKGISIKSLSFSYPGRVGVLKGIDLEVGKNRAVAIVGESGSGKSTLADLMMRLHEPTEGSIVVDGTDYREFTRDSWLRHIAMVSQDTFLFHASVAENIQMGNPIASDTEVVNAAKVADAYRFIMDLPDKFDTILGDRGVKLSGGQRQRIAIARAVVREPDILILDEATSALDNISEKVVQHALKEAMKDKTTIVIAHRLSTIENVDKIVVMKEGEIVEQGTHEELMKTGGYYLSLYQKQRRAVNQEIATNKMES